MKAGLFVESCFFCYNNIINMDYMFLVFYVFVFIFGLCVGSFLNCAIYRQEQEKSLKGRSFCPKCKHTLFWYDLFPVFSFAFLGGKCRYCKTKISWQYPAVELATGVIFVMISKLLIAGYPVLVTDILNLAFLFYVASALIFIFVYDLKHYLIPDKVLFPAIVITFIFRLFVNFNLITNFLFAVVIASGFFLSIFLISRGKAMGFGDVKLAILMGLLLGLPNILVALFIAFFFGAIIGLLLMLFGRKSAGWRMKSEIPFGPFLILGTFIALLWGSQIIQWYINFFQI